LKIVKTKKSLEKAVAKIEKLKKFVSDRSKSYSFSEVKPGDIFLCVSNKRYYVKINSTAKYSGVDLYNGKVEDFSPEDRVNILNVELVEK